MTHGGLLGDYVGEGTVPGPVIPIVCIPTTSGTGSQNSQSTVFTLGGVKQGCSSEYIRPVASIVDPELTMGLPPIACVRSSMVVRLISPHLRTNPTQSFRLKSLLRVVATPFIPKIRMY
jgi:alcohol dehydrogenase class IV